MESRFPKISIVTPVHNQVKFLEGTILSVINQNYPNLEYFVIDGGSTDGTIKIIKKYEDQLSKWISEEDKGMYDALNKGFGMSSGEIMCWINSDDVLLPGAFNNMVKLFEDLPEVNWIQGLNSYIDLENNVINTHPAKFFSFIKFLNSDYKWIQQESTFWRRELWERAGGEFDKTLKLAGDFDLWFRFFQHDKLYNTSVPIGAWRKREGQLSGTEMKNYLKEVRKIVEAYPLDSGMHWKIKRIKTIDKYVRLLKKLKFLNSNFLQQKKHSYYDLNNLEISYSYIKKKFTI